MSRGQFISISIIDLANVCLNPLHIIVCIYVIDKCTKFCVYRLIVSCEFRRHSSSCFGFLECDNGIRTVMRVQKEPLK